MDEDLFGDFSGESFGFMFSFWEMLLANHLF
jgi:hypothetical protein